MSKRTKLLVGIIIIVAVIAAVVVMLTPHDRKETPIEVMEAIKPVKTAPPKVIQQPEPAKIEKPVAVADTETPQPAAVEEEQSGGSISGTVYHEDTEEPLAGVSVRLAYPGKPRRRYEERKTTSDTDGHYAFYGFIAKENCPGN